MSTPPGPSTTPSIPTLVKRNALLIAAAQAASGMGIQLLPALGPIMVVRLLGSATFAGVSISLLGVSRFLVAYPVGALSDRYGRKPGLMLGLLLSMAGALVIAGAMAALSFPLLLGGLLVFGLGVGATQQMRVAAADMFPAERRAEGLGLVLTGSLVGALGGPALVSGAQAFSPRLGVDAIVLAWGLVPLVLLPALLLIHMVRPDPKEIAARLREFYPGQAGDAWPETEPAQAGDGTFQSFLRDFPKLAAFAASFAVQGNMSMMMAMTSLTLDHHGHSLAAISVSVSIHVIGMFGFSLPLGRAADRFGRRALLLVGVAISGVGAPLIVVTPEYWVITAGTFLVGLGWSCVNVAATALLSDTTNPEHRARAVGANDTFSGASGIVLPLAAGPIADALGLGYVGALGVAVMVLPLALLLRLREPAPGRYV